MLHYGHIHLSKIDDSSIIYPGSLTSCGFDELGDHGMVYGELSKDGDYKNVSYKFQKIGDINFEIQNIDISNCASISEVINKININNNFLRIVLTGTRNIEIEKLIEDIKALSSNICDIVNETKASYNLEQISSEKNLKGVFTKIMLEELEKEPEKEDDIMKAIEYVYNNL